MKEKQVVNKGEKPTLVNVKNTLAIEKERSKQKLIEGKRKTKTIWGVITLIGILALLGLVWEHRYDEGHRDGMETGIRGIAEENLIVDHDIMNNVYCMDMDTDEPINPYDHELRKVTFT